MPKDLATIIRELTSRADEQGFVTYEEINTALPASDFTSEEIEWALVKLAQARVTIREDQTRGDAGWIPRLVPPRSCS